MISQISKQKIEDMFLGACQSSEHPVIYATCGIPGAGKSTFVAYKLEQGDFPQNAFYFNPDKVMEALPEYQTDCQTIGAQAAYQKWELPCRELAYAMADRAAENKFNVIKDMGCANPLSLAYIQKLKQTGYRIEMHHIDCDINEAFYRIDQREFRISREEVQKRYALLDELLPLYREIADIFVTYDNTNVKDPYQIAA